MNDDTREQVRVANKAPRKMVLAVILESHESKAVEAYMNQNGFAFSQLVPISMNPGKQGALFTRMRDS